MNDLTETKIKLKGLNCSACQKIVERRLKNISGVFSVEVVVDTGDVKIVGTRQINTVEIEKALEGTEFNII